MSRHGRRHPQAVRAPLAGEGQVQRAIAGRADAGRRRATGEKRLVQDMSGAKRCRSGTAEER